MIEKKDRCYTAKFGFINHQNPGTMIQVQNEMETVQKEYTVERKRIGFVKFIFEAHEGIAVVTTIDSKPGAEKGGIRLSIAPSLTCEAEMIIQDLKKDFMFDEV